MVKIDDRTATSIMRSWCIIRADVEIHVTDRIEKHEVTDLFIYTINRSANDIDSYW